MVQVKTLNVRRNRLVRWSHLLKPEPIVAPQGLAYCESRQSSTVALFGMPLFVELIELGFGNRRKPATKAVPILKAAQLDNIRYAVVIGIGQFSSITRVGFRSRDG